jgi:hypothetical protein
MGKIINFPDRRYDQNIAKLKDISDSMDKIIIEAVSNGMDPNEVAGILAHRLGALMRNMEQKSKLWDVCERLLKRQAAID